MITEIDGVEYRHGVWAADVWDVVDGYKEEWDKDPFFQDMGFRWDPGLDDLRALYKAGQLFVLVAYRNNQLEGAFVGSIGSYTCDKSARHCYELLWFVKDKSPKFLKTFFDQLDIHLRDKNIHTVTLAYPHEKSALMKSRGYVKTQPMYMKRL